MSNQIQRPEMVPFHGAMLPTVRHDGKVYVALKPIVEGMGMHWDTQFRKLKNNPRHCHMTIPLMTGGGPQSMTCIPLDRVRPWLMTINPRKVRKNIRPKVIRFQEECCRVLNDYWQKGIAINPRMSPDAQIDDIIARRFTELERRMDDATRKLVTNYNDMMEMLDAAEVLLEQTRRVVNRDFRRAIAG